MAETHWLHERKLYRPGRPGQEVWLQLQRADADTVRLRVRRRTCGEDWTTTADTQYPASDETSALVRLEHEVERRLRDGYQLPGVSILPCTPARTPSPAAVARLLAVLDAQQWRLLSPARRARVAWRLGELHVASAAPALQGLIGSGDALLDYCLTWALGRCGSTEQALALAALASRPAASGDVRAQAARRLARVAWLEIAAADQREHWAAGLVADWPVALRMPWQNGDDEALQAALAEPQTFQRLSPGDWLEQLDQVARVDPRARAILRAQLAVRPVAAGDFRALRHLYKAAEMRGDGEVWALLVRRFEASPGTFAGHEHRVFRDGKWIEAEAELARADARLAWSRRTRGYFLRRSWRSLRRLGAAQSPVFAPLACAALLAFDDAQGEAPGTYQHSRYDSANRRWQHEDRHIYAWSGSLLLNRLLFRPGGSLCGNRAGSWWWSAQALPERRVQREESFPELWDERPDLLLRLLLEARSAQVHAFAACALAGQTSYLEQLDQGIWLRLLNSVFGCTASFAFEHLRTRIESAPDAHSRLPWLRLLLQSRHESIWQAALRWISEDPAAYSGDADLLAAMLTARAETVRRQARLLAQAAIHNAEVLWATVGHLLEWLEQLDTFSEDTDVIVPDLVWALANPLRSAAERFAHARLIALLAHPVAAAQIAAVDWLLLHTEPVSVLPASAYKPLLESSDERVQSAGVRLFAALPDAVLLTQAALVARFCMAPSAAVRTAAKPVVIRLAPDHPAFSGELAATFTDALFRAESAEGLHEALFALLTEALAPASDTLDTALAMRLVSARSRGAQRFGAWLLGRRDDDSLGNGDWAALARVDTAALRARALRVFAQRMAAQTSSLDDLLTMLSTRWDDTRQQAIALLRERVPASEWTAARLIDLCDHLHPEVQALGRELITPRLRGETPLDYLLPLAEHPAPRMQAFVADWLATALPADPALLATLRPYFLAVLSQVNRGRAAKNHVQALLRELSSRSEALATEVAALFERLVLTVAIADRAQYVAGLYEIRARFPAIGSGLRVLPPELRQGAA